MRELGLVVPLYLAHSPRPADAVSSPAVLRPPACVPTPSRGSPRPRTSGVVRCHHPGRVAGPPSGRPAVREGPARGGDAHPNGWARPHFGSPRVTYGLPRLLGSGNGAHGCFQCPPTGYRGHDGAPTFGSRSPRGLHGPCRPRGCSPPGESGRGCPPTPHVPSAGSILSPQQFAAAPHPKAQKSYAAVLLSREWCNVADGIILRMMREGRGSCPSHTTPSVVSF